jgi:3-dehydroquinate synthetase
MLNLYKLPVNTTYKAEDLARACLADKKRDGDQLTLVFPAETGKCILKKIRVDELENIIKIGLKEADK